MTPAFAAFLLAWLPLGVQAQESCPDRSAYAPAREIIADLGRITAPTGVQETLLCQTSELLTKAASAEHHLEGLVEQLGRMDNVHDMAVFCHDMIMPAMQDLRDPIDRLELIVDKDIWPVPTYGDLMFEV